MNAIETATDRNKERPCAINHEMHSRSYDFLYLLYKGKWYTEGYKETYGQTRGLSSLQMKHVGELAITGLLLKVVKTRRGHTTQLRSLLSQKLITNCVYTL